MTCEKIAPPYPWFGGKRKIAPEVWKRFGNVSAYAEPFLGGGAVFLARPPGFSGVEFINDADGFVTNFWRAAKREPDNLVDVCCDLASEIDIAAKHKLLVEQREGLTRRLTNDVSYYDVVLAGYWWLGLRSSIGAGWCTGSVDDVSPRKLKWKPKDNTSVETHDGVRKTITDLCARLKSTTVLCGDWSRCVTDSYIRRRKNSAVFLDPPYSSKATKEICYACEDKNVSAEVLRWCLDRSNDSQIRIAFCGYDGEDGVEELELLGWEKLAWNAGGYKRAGAKCSDNAHRERVWFSPSCLKATP